MGRGTLCACALALATVAVGCQSDRTGVLIRVVSPEPLPPDSRLVIALGVEPVDNGMSPRISYADFDAKDMAVTESIFGDGFLYFISPAAIADIDDVAVIPPFPVAAVVITPDQQTLLAVGFTVVDVSFGAGEIREYRIDLDVTVPRIWSGCIANEDISISIGDSSCDCPLEDPFCDPGSCVPDEPLMLADGDAVFYEACDGRDSDCDQTTFHNPEQLCYARDPFGVCSVGVALCADEGAPMGCDVRPGSLSLTAVEHGLQARSFCDEWEACSFSEPDDPLSCVHTLPDPTASFSTVVCRPRFMAGTLCTGENQLSTADLLLAEDYSACEVFAVTGGQMFPTWSFEVEGLGGMPGRAAADDGGCDVTVRFKAPSDNQFDLKQAERLLIVNGLTNGMDDISEIIRVLIIPEEVSSCDVGDEICSVVLQ